MNNYPYSNPFYRGFYPNISSALPVPLSNSFINIGAMPLTQEFSPAFNEFQFLPPFSQIPQPYNNTSAPNIFSHLSHEMKNVNNACSSTFFLGQNEPKKQFTDEISKIPKLNLINNKNEPDLALFVNESESLLQLSNHEDSHDNKEIPIPIIKTDKDYDKKQSNTITNDNIVLKFEKINSDVENKSIEEDKILDENILIETVEWKKSFKSKEEALIYHNEKGAEVGIEFKLMSIKHETINKEEDEQIVNEKVVYSFTLFCKEHYRNSIVISSNKNRQLQGCNAKVNFLLDRHSIKIKDSKLDLIYNKTKFFDLHSCKPDKLKIENRNLINTSFKEDIIHFDKNTPVKFVKEFMNSKQGKNINASYGKVWYELSKKKIKYKDNDSNIFIEKLEKDNIDYDYVVKENDIGESQLESVIFSTKMMQQYYSRYNDVIFLDTTYSTNKYNLPAAFISTLDNRGKNIILAVAFLKDEKKETFLWLFKAFLKLQNNKSFNIILTDYDKAMDAALEELITDMKLPTTHLLCHWHLNNNFIKHFSWLNHIKEDNNLSTTKRKEIYKNILQLRNIDSEAVFDKIANEISSTFQNEYIKSFDYIQHIISIKHKWSKAYITKFTAASFSTSRAESIHAQLKKIYKSPQELNFIFEFLSIHDKNSQINEFKFTKAETNIITKNLILSFFNNHYTSYGMKLLYAQFIESMSYQHNEKDGKFEVFRVGHENKARILEKNGNILECPCKVTLFSGIICRHIFSILQYAKDLEPSKYLHSRWKKDSLEINVTDSKILTNNDNDIKFISNSESDYFNYFKENQNQNESRSSILQMEVDKITSNTDLTENGEAIKSKISNPLKIQRKGRPRGRPKGCLEKNKKRKATKERYAPKSKKVKIQKSE